MYCRNTAICWTILGTVVAVTSSTPVAAGNARSVLPSDRSMGIQLEPEATLQVSIIGEKSDGTWDRVRSLGGPLADIWLSLHEEGHPNTTVVWSNGTIVRPAQVANINRVSKRFDDGNIELLLWDTPEQLRVGNAGFIAGFAAQTVTTINGKIAYWMYNGPSIGANAVIDGNFSPESGYEPYIYYEQSVSNKVDDSQWPSTADMQRLALSMMQDMANNDFQRGCYEAVTHVQYRGGSCLTEEFAQLKMCSWPWDGQCTTPACANGLGASWSSCTALIGSRIIWSK